MNGTRCYSLNMNVSIVGDVQSASGRTVLMYEGTWILIGKVVEAESHVDRNDTS